MASRFLIVFLLAGWHQVAGAAGLERKPIDLPGFEQGDLYVLGRLSNAQLIEVERSEWVHVAILIRDGLDPSYRQEALTELAKLRETDELTQLVDGIRRAGKNTDKSVEPLNDLIALLMAKTPAELKGHRDTLVELSIKADRALIRRAGYAAMVVADGGVSESWRLVQGSNERLADLLNAIPMIPDAMIRSSLRTRIEALIHQAPSRPVRQAAILAVASMPTGSAEVFVLLSSLVAEEIEPDTAIRALLRLPSDQWPEDPARDLLENIIIYLKGVDPTQRNTPNFRRARQLGDDLASRISGPEGKAVRETLKALGIRTVTVSAVPYSMRFDRVHMVVEPGTPIEITLENPDMWLHNLVIVAPGTLEEIGVMASQMLPGSENWQGRQYVPNSEKVLYATRVVKTGQSDTITIVAPEAVGDYPYLCTYPGHWVSMNGILHVVEDVDAWIAANPVKATGSDPAARTFVREWQLEDLTEHLDQLNTGRSLERGQALFTVGSCVACHQVGSVGGVLGPHLDEVSRRMSLVEMLGEILHPSKTINEAYRTSTISLNDDSVLTGIIAKQNDRSIELIESSQINAAPTTVLRDQIVEIRSSQVSTMPMGLLNTFTQEEILDLLAYIRSGGVGPPKSPE